MELVIYEPKDDQKPQEILFNYEELKKELAEKLKKYEGLVYTESSIKDAKKDRAALNNFVKAIETRRKEIKTQCMKPYTDFETKVKDLVAMVEKPVLAIDKQVKSFEEIKKEEKLQAIKQFYTDKVADLADLVPFEKINNPKWMNATYKEKDIYKEITDLFIKVENDLKVIDELESDYKLQAKDAYLKTFDLTMALQEKKRLEEQAAKLAEHQRLQKEKEARAKEARDLEKARLQQTQPPAQSQPTPKPPVQEAPAPAPEPTQPEQPKIYEMRFKVHATISQLKALRQFFEENNIKFEKVVD